MQRVDRVGKLKPTDNPILEAKCITIFLHFDYECLRKICLARAQYQANYHVQYSVYFCWLQENFAGMLKHFVHTKSSLRILIEQLNGILHLTLPTPLRVYSSCYKIPEPSHSHVIVFSSLIHLTKSVRLLCATPYILETGKTIRIKFI